MYGILNGTLAYGNSPNYGGTTTKLRNAHASRCIDLDFDDSSESERSPLSTLVNVKRSEELPPLLWEDRGLYFPPAVLTPTRS